MPMGVPRVNRRQALVNQLKEWRDGNQNPVDNEGRAEPLRVLTLKLDGHPEAIAHYQVDAKTDHVARADEIMMKCNEFANEVNQAGEAMIFMLYPFFGNARVPGEGGAFPIRITPQAQFAGVDQPIGDLRTPATQSTALVRESISLTRDAWSFTGNGMRLIIESLEKRIEELSDDNKDLKAELKEAKRSEQDMLDRKQERDNKQRKEDMKLMFMELGGRKLIGYIPILTSNLDKYLSNKFGARGTPEAEAGEYRTLVKDLVSRMQDIETVKKVAEALKLTEVEQMKFLNMGKELLMDEQRAKLAEEANAAMRGLSGMGALRALPAKK